MAALPKKIIIFGATGNTGLCCLKAAIEQGHFVSTFVRDPSLIPSEYKEKITVIKGDITDATMVEESLKGMEAAVVTIGTRNDLSPTTVLSEGLKNILNAMKKNSIKRVSVCISAFLFLERSKVPERFHPLTEDHERMLDALKASDCEWIAVLPPHIADSPAKGDFIVECCKKPEGRVISKYDLGAFLVNCLEREEYFGKYVGICDKPQG